MGWAGSGREVEEERDLAPGTWGGLSQGDVELGSGR